MNELQQNTRSTALKEAIDYVKNVDLLPMHLDNTRNIHSALQEGNDSMFGLHNFNARMNANCLGINRGLEAIEAWSDQLGSPREKTELAAFIGKARADLSMILYPDLINTGLHAIEERAKKHNSADVDRAKQLFHETIADVSWGAAKSEAQLRAKMRNVTNLNENSEVKGLLCTALARISYASLSGREPSRG